MNQTPVQISRDRQNLSQELAKIRRASMQATERRDFREVARLTLEAAKLNKAISDSQIKSESLP